VAAIWSLLEFFPDLSPITVLDVGAALLERPPYQPLMDAGVARLYAFEPDPAACARLREEYGEPHRFFQCFVGAGGPATFHATNWSPTGSLYAPNTALLDVFQNLAELMTPLATHPVTTVRIDDIAEIGDVDFIKIDVQGAELSVLENATRVLPGVLLIQVEVEFVEMYVGQPMFADVDRFLRSQGFQFHTFPGFGGRAFKPLVANGDVNEAFRQHLWSDAIYVRDWMHLDRLPEEKLRRYAILAHDILTSLDLVHRVLATLDAKTGGRLAQRYVERLKGFPISVSE